MADIESNIIYFRRPDMSAEAKERRGYRTTSTACSNCGTHLQTYCDTCGSSYSAYSTLYDCGCCGTAKNMYCTGCKYPVTFECIYSKVEEYGQC